MGFFFWFIHPETFIIAFVDTGFQLKLFPFSFRNFNRGGGGGGEGRGRLLVNGVPMREQRTVKLALNSVFNILIFYYSYTGVLLAFSNKFSITISLTYAIFFLLENEIVL